MTPAQCSRPLVPGYRFSARRWLSDRQRQDRPQPPRSEDRHRPCYTLAAVTVANWTISKLQQKQAPYISNYQYISKNNPRNVFTYWQTDVSGNVTSLYRELRYIGSLRTAKFIPWIRNPIYTKEILLFCTMETENFIRYIRLSDISKFYKYIERETNVWTWYSNLDVPVILKARKGKWKNRLQ